MTTQQVPGGAGPGVEWRPTGLPRVRLGFTPRPVAACSLLLPRTAISLRVSLPAHHEQKCLDAGSILGVQSRPHFRCERSSYHPRMTADTDQIAELEKL